MARPTTHTRGATTDEARKLIEYAHDRCRLDRRSKSQRDVYYYVQYVTGGRRDEPASMKWRENVFENGDGRERTPHWRYTPRINKNGLDEDVPMSRECQAVIKAHRAALKELSKTVEFVDRIDPSTQETVRAYVDPDHPEAYLFPSVPAPHVLIADRAACGIEARDRKGRAFSWHSARAWFVETLTDLGFDRDGNIVRRLARHGPDAHGGYYHGNLATLATYIERLPELWPKRMNYPPTPPAPPTEPTDGPDSDSLEDFQKIAGLPPEMSRYSRSEAEPIKQSREPASSQPPSASQPRGGQDGGSFAARKGGDRPNRTPVRDKRIRGQSAHFLKECASHDPLADSLEATAGLLSAMARLLTVAALAQRQGECDAQQQGSGPDRPA